MTDKKLMKKCEFIGGVIPKLSKIYDYIEALDCVTKVDEVKCDYNDSDFTSEHMMRVVFKNKPLHNELEILSGALYKIVSAQKAELVYQAVHFGEDATSMMFEMHIKWEVK